MNVTCSDRSPVQGGGVRRVRRRPSTLEALGCPRSPRPPSAALDATGASGKTHTAAMQNAAPVMDAAFAIGVSEAN